MVKGKVNLLEIATVTDLTSNVELLQAVIAVLEIGKISGMAIVDETCKRVFSMME